MVEHHTFDAMMPASFHGTPADRLLRYLGGVAAPTFLFLAGLSMVLLMEGLVERGATRRDAALSAARRGGLILLGAYLFRFQEWALAWGASPAWTMLRIDVLNCIGLSLIFVALLWGLCASALSRALLLSAACAAVVLATPLVLRADLSRLPLVLADYLNGSPPRALFPLFPWAGYALGGGALGLLFARARRSPEPAATFRLLTALALGSIGLWAATLFVDGLPFHLYQGLDWWRASPAYYICRCCSLVLTLWACAAFEKLWLPLRAARGWQRPGPLVAMGRHSLAIYWVHIEIVYGRLTWPVRGTLAPWQAGLFFALLLAAMLGLAQAIDPALARLRALWQRRPSVAA
jgi:uncharacterized membrane protein